MVHVKQKLAVWIHVLVIISLGLLVRLQNLNGPIMDRHSFRQTDTFAMIVRQVKGDADLFHPRFFHALDPRNTQRFFLAELPVYQSIVAWLFGVFGERLVIARLVNIVLSLVAAVGVYAIGNRLFKPGVGFAAGLAFVLFPSSIFWSRGITPDIFGLTCLISAIALVVWRPALRNGTSLLAGALFTGAVLTKPTYFAFAPLLAWMLRGTVRETVKASTEDWAERLGYFWVTPILLFAAWRLWLLTFPESARVDPNFLLLMHNGQGYLKYWQESNWPIRLFTERLFGELLTTQGGVLMTVGLVYSLPRQKNQRAVLLLWLLADLTISLVISWGSTVHDYYLLHWLPLAAVLVGAGVQALLEQGGILINKVVPGSKQQFAPLVVGTLILWGLQQEMTFLPRFFAQDPLAMYSSGFNQDYQAISTLLQPGEKVITLLPHYTPYVLNELRVEGNVLEVPNDLPCALQPAAGDILTRIHQIMAEEEKRYLIVQKRANGAIDCPRYLLNAYFGTVYQQVYSGSELDMYELVPQKIEVFAEGVSISILASGLGKDIVLEVGGIPGHTTSTLVHPEWEQVSGGSDGGAPVYRAIIPNAQEWQSFKLYWRGPEVVMSTTGWSLREDGWTVKK